jgi:hypothetical protein
MAGCIANTELVAVLCIQAGTSETDVPTAIVIIPHTPTALMLIGTSYAKGVLHKLFFLRHKSTNPNFMTDWDSLVLFSGDVSWV